VAPSKKKKIKKKKEEAKIEEEVGPLLEIIKFSLGFIIEAIKLGDQQKDVSS